MKLLKILKLIKQWGWLIHLGETVAMREAAILALTSGQSTTLAKTDEKIAGVEVVLQLVATRK